MEGLLYNLLLRMLMITGATGFIGRRLIKRLVQKYPPGEIVCLVYDQDSEQEKIGRLLLDELGIRYFFVDLVSGRGLEAIPKSPDIVLHLASNTDTGSADHTVNDVGTKHLLEAIQPFGENGHFVFASTISVSDHRKNPDLPGDENSELLRPYSEYGRAKLKTEELLKQQCHENKFSLSILRISLTYGSGTRENGLFDALVRLAGRGSLLSRMDYPGRITMMHVEDVADVLTRLAERNVPAGISETFLAYAEALSIHEMSAAIYAALGLPFRPIKLPRWFWSITQWASPLIYALESYVHRRIYNPLWQLTLLVNNGYHVVSSRLRETFPDKTYRRFAEGARDLLPSPDLTKSSNQPMCPICESKDTHLQDQKLDVYLCHSCLHPFTHLPAEQQEKYSENYFQEMHKNWFANPDTGLFERILLKMRKYTKTLSGNSWLDVGCGNGDLLKYLSPKLSDMSIITGIDLAPNPYLQGDFHTYLFTQNFGIITSLMSIEHIENPKAFIQKVHRQLLDDGLVIFTTINSDSLIYKLARLVKSFGYRGVYERLYHHHHLQHFNNDSLKKLFENNGFDVLEQINYNFHQKALDLPKTNWLMQKMMEWGVMIILCLTTHSRYAHNQMIVARKK